MHSGLCCLLSHCCEISYLLRCMKNPGKSVGKEATEQTDSTQGRYANGRHSNRSLGNAAMPTKIALVSPKVAHPLATTQLNPGITCQCEHKCAQDGLHFSSTLHPNPISHFSHYDKNTAGWGPQTTTTELPQFCRLEVQGQDAHILRV